MWRALSLAGCIPPFDPGKAQLCSAWSQNHLAMTARCVTATHVAAIAATQTASITPALWPDGAGLAQTARRAAARQASRLAQHGDQLRRRLGASCLLRAGGAVDVAAANG